MKNKGSLIVLSGPSGCGKSTISQALMDMDSNIIESVSMTTRKIREKEIDGVDYYFKTVEEFKEEIEKGNLLEYAIYSGNYYGTPKQNVIDKLNQGYDILLVIEIEGALKIKEQFPDAIFIFILPPSIKELKKRLDSRNTETKEQLFNRFQTMYKEINEVKKYNYVVVNDNLDKAIKDTHAIITSSKCRVDRIEEDDLYNLEEEIHEVLVSLNEE